MVGEADPGLFDWKHGGWRRAATAASRRAMLILHIEEVERFAAESQSRGNRLTLHQNVLPGLIAELEKLNRAAGVSRAISASGVGGVRRYRRGGAA